MGDISYQGTIGGFVFVSPVSGRIKVRLYATTAQYPAILYQILQEIESEGYSCRELYCDTHSVNLSAAAEEVAGMFKVKIIPISGGTPQELAYAESAVRTLGQMSRSLMLGAPHLPLFCWGLSDYHAANIHSTIPQKHRQNKSPIEITSGREPDLDLLFLHIFGCPCQYEPANEVDHKRSAKTEWGWFVGVQWPMALVLRPSDNKVLSISRKKVHCHEIMYARFDPTSDSRPKIEFSEFALSEDEVDTAINKAKDISNYVEPIHNIEVKQQGKNDVDTIHTLPHVESIHISEPDHVLCVKCLSDYKPNNNFNTASVEPIPDHMKLLYNNHQSTGLGGEKPCTGPVEN
jgi:hypothetical protein